MKSEKIRSVSFDNRKRQISVVYTSGKEVTAHYGQLGIRKKIQRVWVDKATRGRSIGIEFLDGTKDYMPFDQPLSVAGDPEFLLQTQIELLIAKIKGELKRRRISKRYLAEKLQTSDNQIQRLLNPTILNKNVEQLYKIAGILHLHFKIGFEDAA